MRGRSSSDRRPNSAGATRSRGSYGFSRHASGSSNFGHNHSQGSGAGMAGLLGHGYTTHSSSGHHHQRPSSAGHTRPTVASHAHQHHNHHHMQQHYQQGQQYQQQTAVPTAHTNAMYTPQSLSQGQPIAQLLNSHNIPTATAAGSASGHHGAHAGAAVSAPSSGTGYARPKSAGSVRRPAADPHNQLNQHNYPGAATMSQNIYGTSGSNVAQQQYQRYAQQQQVRPAPTLDPQVTINHYTFSANAMAANAAALNQQQQQQQTAARPLSASATAHTTKASSHDRWYANNRTNYGYSAAQAAAMNNSGSVHSTGATNRVTPTAVAPQVGSYKPTASAEKTLSRPSSKLRDAVDLSHKIEAQGGDASAALKQQDLEAGIDNDDGDGDGEDYDEAEANGDEVMGLDAQRPQTAGGTQMGLNHHFRKHRSGGNAAAAGAAAVGASAGGGAVGAAGAEEEQEEMDGKPVDQSRSHPEVSMTTPSASLELAHASSSLHQNAHNSNGVDARNSSFDSLTEDNLQIGLSTVPNQFCTKRDALDLRKLISLSAGTRGGIVPSSSAVMDMYMVGKVVGVGSYGKVRAAWHRLTSAKVAIKTYDKSKMKDPAHWKRVHSEIKIMEQVSHPRIARMYEAVETPKRMHLIMECLDGGNLCSYVKAKRRLSEDESRRIFFQILQAIEYLHGLGVAHRDVKLENVLFANEKEIKLIDFGFSTVCQPGKRLKVFCGTPSYMAPEIVRRSEYEGKPVDMWSMGILLYALLCGCFPFRAKAYPDLYRRIARGTFPMPEELSAPVKDLLKQLLTVDANTRITAHAALRHSWLQQQLINAPNIDKMRLESPILISDKPADDLDDQVIDEIEKFGMPRDEVVRLVLTKTHSSLATLYYLLLNLMVQKRRQAAKNGGNVTSSANGKHALAQRSKSYNGSHGNVRVRDAASTNAAAAAVGSGAAAVAYYRAASSNNYRTSGQQDPSQLPPDAELLAQQAAAEQLAILHHQQHMIESHDQQRLRQKQASAPQPTRSGGRPQSAPAVRR